MVYWIVLNSLHVEQELVRFIQLKRSLYKVQYFIFLPGHISYRKPGVINNMYRGQIRKLLQCRGGGGGHLHLKLDIILVKKFM